MCIKSAAWCATMVSTTWLWPLWQITTGTCLMMLQCYTLGNGQMWSQNVWLAEHSLQSCSLSKYKLLLNQQASAPANVIVCQLPLE